MNAALRGDERPAPSRRLRAAVARLAEGPAGVVVLTGLVVGSAFVLQRDLFVGLADEGFLWYGTWRTALGEVPLRDFQSYDPGRYYWGAFWAQLFGHGLVALRASNALFAWVGLSCGVLVLRRLDRDLLFLLLSSLVLFLWMYPRHKLFEPGVAMIATWAFVRLLERPSVARHFAAGAVVGLVACFGRNHGGYALAAFAVVASLAWLRIDRAAFARKAAAASGGIVVGYGPVLGMVLFVPGFFTAFVDAVAVYVRAGTTNITRPVPWLWDVVAAPGEFARMEGTEGVALAVVSALYTFWPVLVVSTLLWAVLRRGKLGAPQAVLAGAAVASAPYFHFAVSRAGLSHLAQGVHPLLIALLALPFLVFPQKARNAALAAAAALLVLSWVSVGRVTPLRTAVAIGADGLVAQQVGADEIRMTRQTARVLETVRRVGAERLGPGDSILVVPLMPTFYPVLARRAPLREIYFTLEETIARQREMIEELERQELAAVLYCDVPIDGRDDLRFPNTHAQLSAYLAAHFAPEDVGPLGPGCLFLARSERGQNPR